MQLRELPVAARLHAAEMKQRSTVYHTPSRALGRRITRWRILGENVGVGVRRDGASLWVTVIFEARRDPGTRLSMPSC